MLSPRAEKLINDYCNLPFLGLTGVCTPYFNNARQKQRGQLRVLAGKGLPQDIVEEAHIISIQYHAGLFEKDGSCCLHHKHTGAPVTAEDIRKFLIDNNLGIECSGFVTNVLREHYRETKGFDFAKKMHIVSPGHIIRWFISRLRPVENIGVKIYAKDENTIPVLVKNAPNEYAKIKPGDLIIVLGKGREQKENHILLITNVQRCHPEQSEGSKRPVDLDSSCHPAGTQNDNFLIEYVHARPWSSEGRYGHGVSRGTITITKPNAGILEQEWREKELTGEKNETYVDAQHARSVEIRRLKML